MAIIFGSDTGLRQNSYDNVISNFNQQYTSIKNGLSNAFTSLRATRPPMAPKENVHVDTGFTNVPGTAFIGSSIDNVDDIQQRTITSQEPILTVYIKKRAFRSLRNENDLKFLDSGEKLFLRATKILFEKKCQQLAAYEALSKAGRLLNEEADLDSDRISACIAFLQEYNEKIGIISDSALAVLHSSISQPEVIAEYKKLLDQSKSDSELLSSWVVALEELKYKSSNLRHATQTTWTVETNQPDIFSVGRGNGVIELTLVNELSTSLSLDGSVGNIDFTMQDPYNLSKITTDEIEYALAAANMEIASDPWQTENMYASPQMLLESAKELERELAHMRKNRIFNAWSTGPNSIGALSNTDNTEIIFEVNPSSTASNKITASIGDGVAFNKNNFLISLLQLPPEQQTTTDENSKITAIFDLLERYASAIMEVNKNYIISNKKPDVEHARRNLRVHYLGKSIVQPMDSVNVYIRGNTFKQNELVGPLSTLLNNSLFIKNFVNQNQDTSDALLEEEMKIMGIDNLDIPVEIYRTLRTDSLMRNAGTHVFGGIIQTVSEDYSADSGVYTTRASGCSNMQWLEQSRVNVAPSLDQTQGLLEDPLTPFDIKVSEATGLVDDEPELNQDNQDRVNAKIINFNNGSYVGEKFDEKNNFVQDYLTNGDGTSIMQYKHAPGIVYKWKQGIIAATRNVNLKTALGNQEDQTQKLRREMGITVISDPFAGQDAADIVSSLVTGYPHNYESFYENSMSFGTFHNSVQSNSPESYFHSFFDIQRSQNRTLGNFQPFTSIHTDPRATHERLANRTDLQGISNNLNSLREQLASLQDQQLALSNDKFEDSEDLRSIKFSLSSRISDIKDEINKESSKWKDKAKTTGVGLRIYGTDFALDFGGASTESDSENMKEKYKKLGFRNTILQFRPQYDCKFNVDSNLFIVGEEYDKDLDIRAFVANMSQKIDLWNSQYKSPRDICSLVAKTLDFEFFCDNHGHIQFRPPRYNKVPLSLLLKMFLLDKREGKKLYPSFLIQLFKSRSKNVQDELDIVDLNIKIESALLGSVEDISTIIGAVGSEEIIKLTTNFNSSLAEDLASIVLLNRKSLVSKVGGQSVDTESEESILKVAEEIKSINDSHYPNMFVNRYHHTNKLAQLISRRQKLEDCNQKLLKQAGKYETTVPANMGNISVPDMLSQFSDLIEDDYNDFLGPNSAKRFIIYDDQIIHSNFTESCENVICRVDVNGEQDLIGEGPGSIGQIPVLWAGATDFDLWRQYGYKSDGGISRPYFKDAETQCAPYALMLLNQNRKKAVRGSLTLYGNEYYQLGDVVYINSRDTLFYVSSVSHNFSYGGSFTTTLTLEYGHPLGEYIPTPLDVIGKGLIKTQRVFNKITTSRQTAGFSLGRHLASIIFPSKESDDERISMLSGDMANYNINEFKNALSISSAHITDNSSDSYPKVEVRGFLVDEDNKPKVEKRIAAVKKFLSAPTGKYDQDNDKFAKISEKYIYMSLQANQIGSLSEPILITADSLKETNNSLRAPKEEVFNLIGQDTSKIENIIEIVLIFKDQENE